ncbi:MAG: twin-arginine translocase TatA/TatE family subunit [Phycisphaerales bacterium]|nr:twin-arginine translocase TatA/TatE family subunit [Phycisphaerales bacterium]
MITTHLPTLAFFNFSGWELAIILVLGLLIFGRRLPELGRSVGKTIVEFKKGLADVQTEVRDATNQSAASGQPNQSLPANSKSDSPSGQTRPTSDPYAQGQYRPPQS